MIQLYTRSASPWDAEPFVARIVEPRENAQPSKMEVALLRNESDEIPRQSPFVFHLSPPEKEIVSGHAAIIGIPTSLNYLATGDIVRVVPRTGEIVTLYRRASPHNFMLLTERCNSRCVMCSQPPKDALDWHLIEAYMQAIPLMDPATKSLGITGGEPTLLGERLTELIDSCRRHLPTTALHMLSNGRLFRYLSLAQKLAEIKHPDLMVGIPLYSDISSRHDFVVQARGAFDDTIRGIMNLLRCGVKVELRVVLHRLTVDRLTSLARFIARNLPSVDHIALMGLELTGYVKMNLDELWVDPFDYRERLAQAVRELTAAHMNVSIYNHPLCLLPQSLWPNARQSISDWKNEYVEACQSCSVRSSCGGFFASSKVRRSEHVRAIGTVESG